MSDEKALLGAIWEHPHEDTPRLMYADWLQENGQPERAEFIRVQCELARLDQWDEERRPVLEKREKRLWKQFEKAWRTELPVTMRKSPFRRGFVSPGERRSTVKSFCALAASAFAAAPVWDYAIEGAAGLAELAPCANLRRVERLALRLVVTAETAETVSQMLGSPHLGNVRTLSLGTGKQWTSGLPALAANAATESLTELDFYEGLDDATAAAVAASPAFTKLRALRAHRHTVTPDGLRAIFNSSHLAQLTELTLPAWYKEEGARAIAETRPAFKLQKLVMYSAWMTDAGVALIANWPGLESVRSFNIGGFCEVLGPQALAASPHAVNLRELDLSGSRLGRAGAMALARSKALNLTRLDIRSTPAGRDETATAALVKRFGKEAVKVRYPGQRKRP